MNRNRAFNVHNVSCESAKARKGYTILFASKPEYELTRFRGNCVAAFKARKHSPDKVFDKKIRKLLLSERNS
jgi:hypothetical protein